MTSPEPSPRHQYLQWVEDQIEDHKASLTREELLCLAEQAVDQLFDSDDEQVPLTEILLRDAVDALIFRRLDLPGYRRWLRSCRSDTPDCPQDRTDQESMDGRKVS